MMKEGENEQTKKHPSKEAERTKMTNIFWWKILRQTKASKHKSKQASRQVSKQAGKQASKQATAKNNKEASKQASKKAGK